MSEKKYQVTISRFVGAGGIYPHPDPDPAVCGNLTWEQAYRIWQAGNDSPLFIADMEEQAE